MSELMDMEGVMMYVALSSLFSESGPSSSLTFPLHQHPVNLKLHCTKPEYTTYKQSASIQKGQGDNHAATTAGRRPLGVPLSLQE